MLIFPTYLGIGTLSTTRASSELARDGDTTSVSESDVWLCFFFHNGKEYDFESILGRLERSGMRTHSLSNLTTRLLPSASELEPGIIIDEVRTVRSGRKTVLVIVADIGYRWRKGQRKGGVKEEKWYDPTARSCWCRLKGSSAFGPRQAALSELIW